MQRLFNLSLSNKTKPLILLFAASFIFVLLVLIQIEPYVYWWTVDSAYNIEAARNFAATGDFYTSTKIGTLDEQTPIMNWPLGYPFIISLLSIITGVKIKWLTVFLSVIMVFHTKHTVEYVDKVFHKQSQVVQLRKHIYNNKNLIE